MDNFYARYPVTGGTSVTSLDGMTGALTLIPGSGITITDGAGTITIATTAGPGPFANTTLSNLTSPTAINQDLDLGAHAIYGTMLLTPDAVGASDGISIETGTGNGSGTIALVTGVGGAGGSGGLNLTTGTSDPDIGTGGISMTTGDGAGAGGSGNFNFVTGATANGASGSFTLASGSSDASSSGFFRLVSGDTANPGGISGNIFIGSGQSNNGDSGTVVIKSGTTGIGNTGSLLLQSADVGGTGGTGGIQVNTGNTNDGASGDIMVLTGNASTTSGNISFSTGGSGTTTSGNVIVQIGGGSPSGHLQILDGSEGTAGHVWTSIDTSGNGHWAAAPASGANTALSNLISTSINQSLVPSSNDTKDLGTSSLKWSTLYMDSTAGFCIVLNHGISTLGRISANLTSPTAVSSVVGLIADGTSAGTGQVPVLLATGSNAQVNATATANVLIESGNKTAGTGNSGDIQLTTGTSSGGAKGSVIINSPLITVGSVRYAARLINAPATISAVTDYFIVYDTNGAGGNLDLPAGLDGLELIFTPKDQGIASYTLVPNGTDTIDPNTNPAAIVTGSPTRIIFLSGTWYQA